MASLAEHGVRATPSYQAMGETLPPQSDAARVALKNSGYDGALVIHVGEGETRYVQTKSPPSHYAYGAPMPSTPETCPRRRSPPGPRCGISRVRSRCGTRPPRP